MKLYYSPGACSLAANIALREAGLPFELERVDLKTKMTETGANFRDVTPKGYVPALILDDGDVATENVALLSHIAEMRPELGAGEAVGRRRLLEALAFISTELHKSFRPLFRGGSEADHTAAREHLSARMQLLADSGKSDYLLGNQPGVADFYLFVMLRWANRFGVEIPTRLTAMQERLAGRGSVRAALEAEGLL